MKIIGNIFKIIALIFLLITSSCGLLSTYGLVEEQINPTERANDGYNKGFDPLREEIKKCKKWKKDEIDSCLESHWKTMGAMKGIVYYFAIGGNISLLILIFWWYLRRRKKRRFGIN